MWAILYYVFHCNVTVLLEPYRVATPLTAALLLSRDVTADADVTYYSVAYKHARGHVIWYPWKVFTVLLPRKGRLY
jgi:hypothetical protein